MPYSGAKSSPPTLRRLPAQMWGTHNAGDLFAALRHMLRREERVQGPAVAAYEAAFARQAGVRYAFSFGSGRVALYGILKALGLARGDEVLLQVPTHIVVANAIRYTGAEPVYVDCDLDTYNMDLAQAEARVTPRARVLLLQHTFGIPVDMDRAQALAELHNLILVEDCVHALGATFNGRAVGSFGRAAFFSTEETKIISSMMGGMAVTDDPDLAESLRAFQAACAWPADGKVLRYLLKLVLYPIASHPYLNPYTRPVYMKLRQDPRAHLAPATRPEEMAGVRAGAAETARLPEGYLERLSNAQAEIALRQLRRLAGNVSRRRAAADAYRALLAPLGFHLPTPPKGARPAYLRYPVWVEDRVDALRQTEGVVDLGLWFSAVLGEARSPQAGGYTPGSCPRAEAVTRHLVNLPTHPRVSRRDIRAIADALAATPHAAPGLQAAPRFLPIPASGGSEARGPGAGDAASRDAAFRDVPSQDATFQEDDRGR